MEDKGDYVAKGEDQEELEISIISGTIENDLVPLKSCDLSCPFSVLNVNKSESEERAKSVTKLCGLMIFCLIVMTVEIVGGIRANSLAVLTDAAHLLADAVGLVISLSAVWATGWTATNNHSFGFNRLEVLGALLSIQLIWLATGILVYEAVHRIVYKAEKVDGKLMFVIAAFGFMINLIMVTWLGHDHSHHVHGSLHACDHKDHGHDGEELCALSVEGRQEDFISPVKSNILNINLQGAYLHIIADLIQSIGVMVAGAIIWASPNWIVVDLICTLVFSVLVLSTTLPLLKNICTILMEGTPSEVEIGRLENGLKQIKGVYDIHDLHVWSITPGKVVMSCHVLAKSGVSSREILDRIRGYCNMTHRIDHVTVQIE